MSSLHMSQLHPARQDHFVAIAASHQSIALPAYRHAVKEMKNNMDESRGRAMVSFATLTAVYAMLCPPLTDSGLPDTASTMMQLSESFQLLRGAREVLAAVGDCKEGCTVSTQAEILLQQVDLTLSPIDARLAALEPYIPLASALTFGTRPSHEINLQALCLLRQSYALVYDPSNDLSIKEAMTIWIEAVPLDYLEALRDLDTGALMILAHWCMMLKQANSLWYLENSGVQILSSICHALQGAQQQESISWPRSVVFSPT